MFAPVATSRHSPSGAGEVHRLAHAVVHRAGDGDATAADPVTHGVEVVEVVNVERDVLHGAAGHRPPCISGMGDAELVAIGVIGVLHERDAARRVQLHEAMERVLHAVHPVERLQLTTEDVGEELDLLLDVRGRKRQMMDAVRVESHVGKGTPDGT